MQIKICVQTLLMALSNMSSMVKKKSINPMISNIKVEIDATQLILCTTDLNILIKIKIPLQSSIDKLSITISFWILYDIIRGISSQNVDLIFLKTYDEVVKLFIKAQDVEFSLPCSNSNDFPLFKEEDIYVSKFQVATNELRNILLTTKHATPVEINSQYHINGIMLHVRQNEKGNNVLRCVATDCHRLALSEVSVSTQINIPDIIIPSKTVEELIRILEINMDLTRIQLSSNRINFQIGNITLISKLIEGNFPKYESIIPQYNTNKVDIPVKHFAKSIELVSKISINKPKSVKMLFKKTRMTLSTIDKSNSTGKINIDISYNGEDMEISFNIKYILDILSNVQSKFITVYLESSFSSVLFVGREDICTKFILMPLSVE